MLHIYAAVAEKKRSDSHIAECTPAALAQAKAPLRNPKIGQRNRVAANAQPRPCVLPGRGLYRSLNFQISPKRVKTTRDRYSMTVRPE